MHRNRFSAFLHDRPWIWVVIGYMIFVVSITFVVAIAIKNREPSVPLDYHGR
jgi:hypothetical protein